MHGCDARGLACRLHMLLTCRKLKHKPWGFQGQPTCCLEWRGNTKAGYVKQHSFMHVYALQQDWEVCTAAKVKHLEEICVTHRTAILQTYYYLIQWTFDWTVESRSCFLSSPQLTRSFLPLSQHFWDVLRTSNSECVYISKKQSSQSVWTLKSCHWAAVTWI